MTKVLHILNEIKFSGAEVMLKTAAPAFKQNKFDSHILSTGIDIGEYASILERSGYTIHHIPLSKISMVAIFIYLYRLIKLFQKEKFDAIHIHPERAFFWHAMLARSVGCRRIIRTVHDVFLFSGFLRIKRKYMRLIARKAFNTLFLSIGESVAEIEQKYFQNPTIILRNWVDELCFYPPTETEKATARKQFGFSENEIVVISVGTCNDKKNHRDIFDAIASLTKTGNRVLKYLHRGTGQLQKNEIEYAEKIGIAHATKFVGYLIDVRSAYWAADIFVMSSKYEGLGNVILEAMNCGLPVILYDVLGMRDTIRDREGGFLVKPNTQELEEAIQKLSVDVVLRKKMAKEAYHNVRKNFSMEKSINELMGIYSI